MVWLIILGVATCLLIALRRVRRRQAPLDDELYSKRVAVDHMQSGVAWVRADGKFGSVNQSFAKTFKIAQGEFAGREWLTVFGVADQPRVHESHSQMMLMGVTSLEAAGQRSDGSIALLNVRLVAVHDGQMRLVGHHCMIEDKTHERDLEQRLRSLEKHGVEGEAAKAPTKAEEPVETASSSLDALRRATGRNVISVLNDARRAKRERVSSIAIAS
jgi:PAS domain S-box-containing protein